MRHGVVLTTQHHQVAVLAHVVQVGPATGSGDLVVDLDLTAAAAGPDLAGALDLHHDLTVPVGALVRRPVRLLTLTHHVRVPP